MTNSNTSKLIKITGDLEDLTLNLESMTIGEIDIMIASIYRRMTEVVGAIMLQQDEMSGTIE